MLERTIAACLVVWTGAAWCESAAAVESDAPASGSGLTEERPDGEVFRLYGKYVYMADAARFTECRSGRALNVWPSSDGAALEAAYLATKPEPGAELLAVVDAHAALRPGMEGDQLGEMIVIDRFVEVRPGEECPPSGAVTLEDTFWRLVELDGKPVETAELRETPHVRFSSDEARFAGFGGCNRFFGAVERGKETRLEFGRIGATMMMCPHGMDLEKAFTEALETVGEYRLEGESLELLSSGKAVARFEAAHF
jgi:heat shock protein HslJ